MPLWACRFALDLGRESDNEFHCIACDTLSCLAIANAQDYHRSTPARVASSTEGPVQHKLLRCSWRTAAEDA
jgi:hypothetical protein